MRSRVMTWLRITQRIARGHFLQTHSSSDVASAHFLDFFTLVGVHLQDTADTLLTPLDRVVNGVAGLDHAGIDTEEGQLTNKRVGHDLECQRREWLVVVQR